MKFYKSFETERLLLRPTGVQDADFIRKLLNTPKWLEYIGDRQVTDETKAIGYIRSKMLPQLERLGYGNYTVIRKDDGALIGSCGLYDREGLEGIDIGFAFLPEYEGQGYAFEASLRLLEAAKDNFKLERVVAITSPANRASQRLLEKLGMRQQGCIQLENDAEELLLYIFR